MASTIILKAAGLQTSPNELDRKDGALIQASNVIIRRNNIIEQRRGFKLYGSELPDTSDRVKQLTTYRNRIIRHYADTLAYDSDGDGFFEEFAGSFSETELGLRMKFVESNGNFYFTTSDGIKKISARSASDFTTDDGFIVDAGAVKAVDATGRTIYTPQSQSAWFPQDSVVAYRVVWGYKDLNNNLILGAPSQRLILSNPMLSLLIRDYTRVLSAIDEFDNTPASAARIADGNYIQLYGLTLNSSANDLQTNLIAVAAKIDNDIFYADQAAVAPLQIASASITSGICTVTFGSGTATDYFVAGSEIYLSGFAPATGTLDGAQTVVGVTGTTITFNTAATGAVVLTSAEIHSNEYRSITEPSVPSIPATNDELLELQLYIENILARLSDEPLAVINSTDHDTVAALDVTTTATTELTITIPQGINSNYFFQVYRSPVAQATGAGTFDDLVPSDELQLVYEAFPTTEELEDGEVTFEDITPDAFRGANLYTNASTGEGILQANDPPPFAKDINRYRNSVFFANTRTRHRMDLNLLGVTQMIADYDNGDTPTVTISNGETTNTYKFIVGTQEITEIDTVADVADSLNGKYFLISSVDTDYYVWFNTGAGVDPAVAGRTGIEVSIITGETANNVAQKLKNKLSTYLDDFLVEVSTNTVTVTNYSVGSVTDAADVDTTFTISVTQQGQTERVQPEVTQITAIAGNLFTSAGTADYFTLNTTLDVARYYFWFRFGAATDPALTNKTGIPIDIDGTETADDVADLIVAAIPSSQFEAIAVSNVVTITNYQYGEASNATEVVANAGFLLSVTQQGALDVLLSPLASPARAVDETARSFVRVINKNPGESVYGYYLSSAFDVPGKMSLEARSLQLEDPFYVLGNNENTGASFNPDIGPENTITNISVASSTVITTSIAHGMTTGDQVMITGTNSTPPVDGLFTATVLSSTTFSIPKPVSVMGTEGALIRATAAVFSEDDEKPNRVYFSKFQQPEAVPIVNYFDVGAQDKAILRIIPLRDSLFVFKEDGLYRISGESTPFQLELFDSSYIMLAPDSGAVCNNVIYTWTTQGIQSLSEGGGGIVSRDIDDIILRIQSSNFPDFKTATWGVGYESDNSYLVYTVNDMDDEFATIAYRYCTLTDSWTTYDLSHIAGVVNQFDDKLYLAASDVAYIEQERKTFSRLDYADREVESVISTNKVIGDTIILPTVTGLEVGDVVVQDQTITTTEFNILLQKLDNDSGVSDDDYLETLELETGDSPRSQLVALAQKLDADPGVNYTAFENDIDTKNGTITATTETNPTVITSAAHGLISGRIVLIDSSTTTPSINGTYAVTVIDANTFSIPVNVRVSGTGGNWQTVGTDFEDLKICYNEVVRLLNTDTGVAFNNYADINNNTIQEAIITEINTITKRITLNLELQYLVGEIIIYKAFESTFTYSPTTMADPLMLKHLREATMMFETRTFTAGVLSFATDLLPEFQDVEFSLDGNGIFGHSNFGTGFFGGFSNSAPFRTYIPRQCQRCRYIVVKFSHSTAREYYRVNGCTITGEVGQSSRAYR
jgi:hypothetical protein